MTSQAEDRGPLRLVLAEDDSTQRMIMTRLLQDAGYVVDAVRTGDEALAKIVGGRYQILITDWDMPGMDGATLCRRVREAQLECYLYVLLLADWIQIHRKRCRRVGSRCRRLHSKARQSRRAHRTAELRETHHPFRAITAQCRRPDPTTIHY